jgi:hypothetical protein
VNGLRRPKVQKLMAPAEQLLWDRNFWQHQGDGLAIFLSHEFAKTYRLPAPFEELLVIGSSFHIKPLLPLLGRVGRFYVLALSLNNVRLFEATPDTIEEIELSFPVNMQEALETDVPEQYLSARSGTGGSNEGRGGALVHGHSLADEEKNSILRFFQTVNQGLSDMIEDRTTPMILAGVDYLMPIYRGASTYQNLLEDGIVGNPDREDIKELHGEAWKIARPLFEESQKKAYEKFQQFSGQGNELAAQDVETAVRAARFGQVETLFVPLGEQIWGRYDSKNDTVVRASEPGPKDEDLMDLAAADTILNSGQVFAVPREQMPGDGELAVILRYALPST